MNNLTNYKYIINILKKYNFKIKKYYGQNFIISEDIVSSIINSLNLNKDDIVLEIGPGIGTMTQVVSKNVKKIVCVEIDSKIIEILKYTLKELKNIEIINSDILKEDISLISKKYSSKNIKILGNLPYYITTPIINHLIKYYEYIDDVVIMVQEEVGKRFLALPSTKEYGSITIFIKYYFDVKIVSKVKNTLFYPKPKVNSVVLNLSKRKEKIVNSLDKEFMFNIIRCVFKNRRKTLINNILMSKNFKFLKNDLKKILNKMNLDENIRGESLDINQFSQLSNYLLDIKNI